MKYIFVAGAPGSKWSSVCKNIYYSDSIDQTDASENREYWHDASGQLDLMHIGAYFDPGMEFGDFFDNGLAKFQRRLAPRLACCASGGGVVAGVVSPWI